MSHPSDDAIRRQLEKILSRPEFSPARDNKWLRVILDWLVDFMRWLSELSGTAPLLYWVLVAACVAALVLLLGHIAWTVRRVFYVDTSAAAKKKASKEQRERLSLAFLAEARVRAAAGDFTEAIRFLFLSRVERLDSTGAVLVEAGGKPVVTVYAHGLGEIWLLHRPEFLNNQQLRRADNAVMLCRLAEHMLEDRQGPLAFDEYFHGLRDRPGVLELLFEPPTLWVTLHGLLLLGLLLWNRAPRFGSIRALAPPSRRSKEEFLNALAALLERKGDYADAYATVRDNLARQIEHELGLPAEMPAAELARAASQRRPVDAPRLLRLLTSESLPPGAGTGTFLHALQELETARNEFFNGQVHR